MVVSGVRRSWLIDASRADFSSSLWRASSACFRSSRNWARSIAMATTPASASSVPGSMPARPRQQADRPGAERSGAGDRSPLDVDLGAPSRRVPAGRIRRRLGAGEGERQLIRRERHVDGAGSGCPTRRRAAGDRRELEVEAAPRTRQLRDRLALSVVRARPG
jgi:hypothetical protein